MIVRHDDYVCDMSREPRNIQPGAVYHLISRFVDREWFIEKETDRENYLKLLGRALEQSRWRLITYGVMSNHIHLGAIAGDDPLDGWIRRVHSPFADWMNRRRDRIGSMFVRGPKSFLVQRADVPNLVAYIHNNPVRAGIVARAGESSWTSHRAYTGSAACPRWLHVQEGLEMMQVPDADSFDNWVMNPERGAAELSFTEEAHERESALINAPANAPAPPVNAAPFDELVRTTAELVGATTAQLRSRSRCDAAVLGRTVAVHCGLSLGLTAADVARRLTMSQQGVSAIQHRPMSGRARELTQEVLAQVRLLSEAGDASGASCA